MEIFLQYLHVLFGCVFAGSAVFVGLCMIPVLRASLNERDRMSFLAALGPRSKTLMWTSAGFLIVTGSYRISTIIGTPVWETPYARLLKFKIALAVIAFGLMAIHDFWLGPRMTRGNPGSPEFNKARRRTIIFAQLQLAAVLGVIWLAVRLRLYTW